MLGSLCLNEQAPRNEATSCVCQTLFKSTYGYREIIGNSLPVDICVGGGEMILVTAYFVTIAKSVCLVKNWIFSSLRDHGTLPTLLISYTYTGRFASRLATFKNWWIGCWTGCPLPWPSIVGSDGKLEKTARDINSFLCFSPASRYKHVGHR